MPFIKNKKIKIVALMTILKNKPDTYKMAARSTKKASVFLWRSLLHLIIMALVHPTLSLQVMYQRTQRMIIEESKCRLLNKDEESEEDVSISLIMPLH